jgi:hypothetical protein
MNTILGFVPRILGLVSSGLSAAQDGVSALSGMSNDNPKKSGIIAIILGWLGVDPSIVGTVGRWLEIIGAYLQ